MKKILIAVGLAALVSSASAQGLINFLNSPATLVTLADAEGNSLGSTPNVAGQFYFQLFIAPAGTSSDAAFVGGVLATNQASAGRFSGGVNVQVPGYAAGSTVAILVRGWSASYGNNYATALEAWNQGIAGYIGSSAIAPNFTLGGFDGTATLPTLPAFGGSVGIQGGFTLVAPPVPEPTSMALAGLGAASLLVFRRRK